jgi:hypothetical protein
LEIVCFAFGSLSLADFSFPFISIKCVGKQTSLPSLIRAKVKRLTNKKLELRNLLKNMKTIKKKKINYKNQRIPQI